MKKKSLLVIIVTLLSTLMIYAQPRKGGYGLSNDRMFSEITASVSPDEFGGEFNNIYSHHGTSNVAGYELMTSINGAGIISTGAGVGLTDFDRNNKKEGPSESDHYLHAGLILGIDAWHGNSSTVQNGHTQQLRSRWDIKPAATFTLSYISNITDDDTKRGSVEIQCFGHYSQLTDFNAKIDASYHVNDWFAPGVVYSFREGLIPTLNFDALNSLKIRLGYGKNNTAYVELVFDEFF